MTREEAIEAIKANYPRGGYHELCEALDIAIKTLEDFEALNAINLDLVSENEELEEKLKQEPFMNKPCISSKVCEHDKEVVLDKIRAEILEYIDDLDIAKEICDIFDKYKAESEG